MHPALKVAVPVAAVAAVAGVAVAVHRHGHDLGHPVAGGVLVGNAQAYDRITGVLLGGFYDAVAADIAATAASGAAVLDVGCGPGHLTRRLADLGLEATGIDLDPDMIERAGARGAPEAVGRYLAADVAALPFEDDAFDIVASTLSMHHWADAEAGLAEMGRVVRPGGTIVIWDLGAGAPLHGHAPDPLHAVAGSGLAVVSSRPWRWPGPLSFVRRIELAPGAAAHHH
jgi:SAM-dependent methyltransferase